MKCDRCGYDDQGTGDTAHVCGPVNVMPIVPDNVIKFWADPRFQLLADMDKLLNGSKAWGGMEWVYHPIHPYKYRPVAEMIREELNKLKTEYGVEE